MEKVTPPTGPLGLFWQSPAVRTHLLAAGRELALAVGAGLEALQQEAKTTGMTGNYPYLETAIGNLQAAVSWWQGISTPATPKKQAATTARKRTVKTTKRGKKPHAKVTTKRGARHDH